jgi:hypothetical protein
MKIIMRHWKNLLIVIVATAWIVIFPKWSNWVTEDPLDTPILLNPPGKVERAIDIRIPEKYEVSLIFERAGQPFEKLKTLIGAGGVCKINEPCSKGIPVPIKWSLSEVKSGINVAVGEVISQNSNGWSKFEVDRNVGFIKAKPGRYMFKAVIFQGVPELESIKSRLAIKARPKQTETWQLSLVWWGGVATIFIFWPLLIFAVLKTVWRMIKA